MVQKKIPLRQRLMNWAGEKVAMAMWAGRLRMVPQRETLAYARIQNLGSMRYNQHQPLIKPNPANLRKFAKTVYARRAINRIKNVVASLQWEIGPKHGATLSRELSRQIEVATACFSSPNHDDSMRTLLEQIVEDYLICGAGAVEVQLGSDPHRPLWMYPVDAMSIQVYPGWSGKANEARYVQSQGYGNVGGIGGIQLRNDELVYIRKDPTTDSPFGIGSLEVAFNSISRQLAVADFAGNLTGNQQPANLLIFKGAGSNDIDRLRNYWRNEVEGQGTTPILGGDGAQVEGLRGTTDDALFLKYQQFMLIEIATAFEISPHNLGKEEHDNRSTAEVAEDRDWQSAIAPCASNIAAYLTREVIQGKMGFSQLEFRFPGLKREDKLMLARVFRTLYEINAITPNQVCEEMGRDPIDSQWGDRVFADVEIAKVAARGVAQLEDKDLPNGGKAKSAEDPEDPPEPRHKVKPKQ